MEAIRDLGFALKPEQAAEIERGKDFVQPKNGPFDLVLVCAPDGIERFEDVWSRRVEAEGFNVRHPRDFVVSDRAANRVKDRENPPRLEAFLECRLRHRAA